MYVNVRLHTTMYNILRHDAQQCTTMFHNVRQCTTKITSLRQYFCLTQNVLHGKIRSITNENIGLTANNRENPRQPTKNYDF